MFSCNNNSQLSFYSTLYSSLLSASGNVWEEVKCLKRCINSLELQTCKSKQWMQLQEQSHIILKYNLLSQPHINVLVLPPVRSLYQVSLKRKKTPILSNDQYHSFSPHFRKFWVLLVEIGYWHAVVSSVLLLIDPLPGAAGRLSSFLEA